MLNPGTPQPILTVPGMSEQAIRNLKIKTDAPSKRKDNIPAELLKINVDAAAELLHPVISEACNTENMLAKWKECCIVKLPKKGDFLECEN